VEHVAVGLSSDQKWHEIRRSGRVQMDVHKPFDALMVVSDAVVVVSAV
jgi:hypothetical protein